MKPFDPTKPYQYRNGEPARILCTDAAGMQPIVGLRKDGFVTQHYANGRYFVLSRESEWDLINTPQTFQFERWVNVYPDGYINYYSTKDMADKGAPCRRIACIKVVIEGKEGDGL